MHPSAQQGAGGRPGTSARRQRSSPHALRPNVSGRRNRV